MKCIGLARRDHSFGSVVVFPPSNMSAVSAQALTAGEEQVVPYDKSEPPSG
jgi:hypothetical protein